MITAIRLTVSRIGRGETSEESANEIDYLAEMQAVIIHRNGKIDTLY